MSTPLPAIYSHPDQAAACILLSAAGLPTEDLIAPRLHDFWGCRDGEKLIGVIGLEIFGAVALVRSLTVAPDWQGQGLGKALLAQAEQTAQQRGVQALYLLTITAENFFAIQGYTPIPRAVAPPVLQQTAEFTTLCPASAVCMTKPLSKLENSSA
ncbi:MAG: GNAT family N-acetyltransferase [Candidatus Competibacteraceae bacterium]|nr:GNAT family N-acetyltransferase [Candidatus Competibacteraceae bacterium]